MSDKVVILSGRRIRTAGQTWQVTEDATVPGIPVEPQEMQTNRHLKVVCRDTKCREWQRVNKGSEWHVRTSRRMAAKHGSAALCPHCGLPAVFADASATSTTDKETE